MRLDAHDLHIETDDKGFIIGESLIGDFILDEAHVWREVRTDFSNLTLNMGVAVDKGVLFRPETASVTLRTPVTDWMSGVFGRRLRIRWKDSILFSGIIKSATLTSQAEHEGDKTYMNITAYSIVELLNKLVLYNFSAPEQTVAERVTLAASGLGLNVEIIECDRVMAALPVGNYKLIEVLQSASDVQLARFYVDRENTLIMDGSTPPDPSILFSDDEEIEGHVCYGSLNMEENVNNSITGVIAQAKQNDAIYVVRRLDSTVVTHEEAYEIDVPADVESLNGWAQSVPLLGYTSILPSGISTYFQEQLIGLELTSLVDIKWKDNNYRAGVKGISHSIRPTRDDRLIWNVGIDLMPGHLIDFTSVSAPSAVRNFLAVSTAPSSVTMTWTRPQMLGDITGYMIRYKDGGSAPLRPTEGFLVTTLDADTFTFTHTGLPSRDTNSYSIWATTGNAAVFSPVATATVTTQELIPGPITNLTITKDSTFKQPGSDYFTMRHLLYWNYGTPGDLDGYDVRVRYDGINPTLTTGELASLSLTQYTSGAPLEITRHYHNVMAWDNTERNKDVRYGIWPRTPNGQFGQPVFIAKDSNETLPPAGTISLQQIQQTQYSNAQVRIFWGNQPEAGVDFRHYIMEYNVQAGGPPLTPNSGQEYVGAFSKSFSASKNYQWDIWTPRNVFVDVSIFAMTWGGLFVRSSAYLFIPPA